MNDRPMLSAAKDGKILAEAAVTAALAVIMALVALFVPLINLPASFLWTLPIIIFTTRHGARNGVLNLLATSGVLSILVSPILALPLVLSFGVPALVLGATLRKHFDATRIIFLTTLTSIVAKTLALFATFVLTGLDPMTEAINSVGEAFAAAEGLSLNEVAISPQELLRLLVPLIIFLMGLIDTFISYWATSKILRRLPGGFSSPTMPPFILWRLPRILLYLFTLSIVGIYWGTTRDFTTLYQISLNVYLLTVLAGLVQGVSLLGFAAQRFSVGRILFILIMFVIFCSGLLTMVLAFTGLFDMYFDYRRRFAGGSWQ